jgi:hypothetical protein
MMPSGARPGIDEYQRLRAFDADKSLECQHLVSLRTWLADNATPDPL